MSDCLSCVRRRRVLPEAQEVRHSNNRVAPAPQAQPIPTERFIRYGPRRDQVEINEGIIDASYLHLPQADAYDIRPAEYQTGEVIGRRRPITKWISHVKNTQQQHR